jgi:hypothetical protein
MDFGYIEGSINSSAALSQFNRERTCLGYAAMIPGCCAISDSSLGSFSVGPYPDVGPSSLYYTNSEIYQLQMDPALLPGKRVAQYASGNFTNLTEVLTRRTSDGTMAVGLFNRYCCTTNISVPLATLGLPSGIYTIRDLFAGAYVGYVTNGQLSMSVRSNDCKLVKLYPGKISPFVDGTNWVSGYEYNTDTYSNFVSGGLLGASYSWRPFMDTNSLGFGNHIFHMKSVLFTNGVQFIPNAGATWWLGGKISQVGFSLGVDDVAEQYGQFSTNVVNVYADGNMIMSGIFSTNTPTFITNFSTVGINQLTVSMVATNGSPQNATFIDFANFYMVQ